MANITWDNTGSTTIALRTQLESLVQFATSVINSFLARPINFDIQLTIDNSTMRFSGGHDVVSSFSSDNPNLWEGVGIHQSKTGNEVSGFDSKININEDYLTNQIFLDSTPQTSNDLPPLRVDGLSVIIHEILHGLGFIGWTNWSTYTNTSSATSPFDKWITVDQGIPYFYGATAQEVYGGPVPLTLGNVFHYGNASGPGSDLVSGLMNGVVYNYQKRYTISDLDLAFLADFGIGTIKRDIILATAGADNIATGAGNDEIRALSIDDSLVAIDTFDGGTGSDTVAYQGVRSAFASLLLANSNIEITRAGSKDLLISIERVSFDDGDLIFDIISANGPAAYRLYGGAFNRTPDEDGFRFWTNDWLDKGKSLHDAAANFLTLPEFGSLYGTNLSTAQFVDQLYLNVLDRPGETEGVQFWNGFLNSSQGDRADVLVLFTQLPEYVGNSASDIANGYWVMPSGAIV